jgi:hypothetical protein
MSPRAANDEAPVQTPEQLLYARWLDRGTRFGLVLLVLLFGLYLSGLFEPKVPLERLPALWTLPVEQYLQATGSPQGWGWLALVRHGDVANLVGIAVLAGISVLCLLALLPGYWRRGDRLYVGLALAEIVVVMAAASGLLTGGH